MTGERVILSLKSVDIRYGDTPVVSDVSFDVHDGEFVTLLGPSGSGKTSLLRAIAGFVEPRSGDLYLNGERINDTPPYERDIGMVFQNYALFPHMTVAENLTFGLRMMRLPRAEIESRVDEALSYVRLSAFGARYPHELSGGQQQRVAIARSIALRPSILLLDEPMSNLDARLRTDMRYELLDVLGKAGITAISVTHHQEEALAMSDRVIVMAAGKVRQIGCPHDIYGAPADRLVADFIGETNLLRCRRVGHHAELVEYRAEAGFSVFSRAPAAHDGNEAILLIRPEHIDVAREAPPQMANALRGTISKVAYIGAFYEYKVDINDYEFLIKRGAGYRNAPFAVGDAVVLSWDPGAPVCLPAA